MSLHHQLSLRRHFPLIFLRSATMYGNGYPCLNQNIAKQCAVEVLAWRCLTRSACDLWPKKLDKVLKAAMLFQDFKHSSYVRIRELPYGNQPWMSQSRLIPAQMSTFDIIPFDKGP